MKHVLVTGASGFIGRHLVDELVARDCRVTCFLRASSGVEHLCDQNVEIVRGHLLSLEDLQSALKGVDTVFHVAGLTHALTHQDFEETNGIGCGVLADACRKLPNPPRLLYVSSLSAVGPAPKNGPPITEQQIPRPISHYGISKRRGERELEHRAADLPCTVLRPGIVFGPHDSGIAAMLDPIYRFRLHPVIGFRTPPLSLIYVQDLVNLMIRAATHGETLTPHGDTTSSASEYSSQGYYFACDDSEYPTYWELGKRFGAAMKRRPFVWPLWKWVGYVLGFTSEQFNRWQGRSSLMNTDKIREATVPSWACSAAKARGLLDFSPTIDLPAAIAKTVDWYVASRLR